MSSRGRNWHCDDWCLCNNSAFMRHCCTYFVYNSHLNATTKKRQQSYQPWMVDDYDVKGNVFVNPTSVYLPSYLPFTVCYMLPIVLSVVLHVCLSLLWCSSLSSTLSLAANTTIQPLSRWLTLMPVASDYAIANFIPRGGNSEMDGSGGHCLLSLSKKTRQGEEQQKDFNLYATSCMQVKVNVCSRVFFQVWRIRRTIRVLIALGQDLLICIVQG